MSHQQQPQGTFDARAKFVARVMLAAAVCSSALACDPLMTLSGRVTDSAGRPVAGVTVRTVCPDGLWELSAVSDEHGLFSDENVGCIVDDCRIAVDAPDGPAEPLRHEVHCEDSALVCGADCSSLVVDVVLAVQDRRRP